MRTSRPVPSLADQGHDTGSTKHTTAQLGRKVENTETVKGRTSRSGRIVKPTAKAKDANASSSSRIRGKSPASPEELPSIDPSPEVGKLIIQLTELLDNWESCEGPATPTPTNNETDPIKVLVTKIHSANAQDQDHYVCSTQFDVEEPETYARAMQCPNAPQWAQAMEEELDQLIKNETWILVPKNEIQPGHRALGGKWVYKVKRDVNGDIARFKARWLVKSYLQQFGVDFDQTFAAVVKPMAFRVLFAIAEYYDLDIDQMDVKTAFLYGLIDQLIYVEIPKGTETEANKDMVCKLLKALYGLKQSPRLWYERLSGFLLEKLGLARIHADHSIFITKAGLNGPIVSTFVDDIKVIAPKGSGIIQRVKTELTAAFSMVDMGPISFYLGLKVERNREKRTIKLFQPAYIDKVLNRFHLDKANTVNTPMKETTLLQPRAEGDGEATAAEKERYQGMTGSIMFSMVETRPDISFATSVASRFAKNLGHQHTEAVKTILRYLKSSRDRGITYGGQDKLLVEGYSDSDWAGDKDSRKSTSGFIFMLNGEPVSWCSKKQPTVALSSTEAEYIALTLAAKEAT